MIKPVLVLFVAVVLPLAAQNTGYLKAKVDPGRAGVFVDGKYVGPAKNFARTRTYTLPVGEHEIRLAEPRYEDLVTKVTIEAGKTTVVRENMKPIPLATPPFGRLRVKHPEKFAAVYINGKYFGHVDEFSNFAQGVLMKPGSYDVKVEPLNGAPIAKTVTIETDKTVIVE